MNRYAKDAIYGLIGGAAGTWVVGRMMSSISKLQSRKDRELEAGLIQEPPTEKLARRISEEIFGWELSNDEKTRWGNVVSWTYGTVWGGVYGILRRRSPSVSVIAGLPFGVSFGVLGNAVLLPAAKLTPPAHRFPLSSPRRGIASHWGYAATAEGVCRLLEFIESRIAAPEPRTNAELRRVS